MKTKDFSFELPEALIAQYPPAERGRSRLMVLDREKRSLEHRMVSDLPALLGSGFKGADRDAAPLLVFNNSRVRKARLLGQAKTEGGSAGAQVEFLLVSKVNDGALRGGAEEGRVWRAMVRRAKRRRPGSRYIFADGVEGEITGIDGELRMVTFNRPIDDDWLDKNGHIPLPPYIKRSDTAADSERYQTVYADITGSSAAPTAGLHFTRELLENLASAGIGSAFVTLHVGLGTFLPVRVENIEDHLMHQELYSIDDETASRIENAKAGGRKIIAVGTTSVRTLESAWDKGAGKLRRGEGSTSIFIYPGYRFNVADALFTNFHTPESTLLMLVSAFASSGPGAMDGREFILESYAQAVRDGYRFFSYGDAMLIK
ncbi:S-adenosylmethionine:tRNA ribosyltransferase-isomerase [Spirochaetia bacterium]|nr:S-adenosylmethionine:tRNA ribosyltransferase-isomerase [Spirochaetia bacterium]